MKYLILILLFLHSFTAKSQGGSVIYGDNVVEAGAYSEYFVWWGGSVHSYSIISWNVTGGDIVYSYGSYCAVIWHSVYREGYIEVSEDLGGQTAGMNVHISNPYISTSQHVQWNTSPNAIEVEGIDIGLTYGFQWQVSTDNFNWTDILGANSYSYLPTNTSATFHYKCIVTSGSITAETNSATVEILALFPGTISLYSPFYSLSVPVISITSPAYGGYCNPANYAYHWEVSIAGAAWQFIGTGNDFPSSFNSPINAEIKIRRRVTCGSQAMYSNTLVLDPVYPAPNYEYRNYIRVNDIAIKGVNSWYEADMLPIGITGKQQTTNYLDGFGKTIQTNSKETSYNSTTGVWKDMIVHYEYQADPVKGNVSRKYLPFASPNNTSYFVTNAAAAQRSFNAALYNEPNNGTAPFFAETIYDNSSLNRVVKEMLPGKDFGGNNIGTSYSYNFNQASESVHIFNVDYSTGNLQTTATLEYPTGKLFKNTITDEKGKLVVTYTDFNGNVILKKVQVEEGSNLTTQHNGWACTYYVYDDFGLLRYTLTPKAVDFFVANAWANNQAILDELCFVYKYDDKGRNVYTKQPGAGFSNTVYDRRDRPVLTQNGKQRDSFEWNFNLYDGLDRPLASGVLMNWLEWFDIQTEIDNSWWFVDNDFGTNCWVYMGSTYYTFNASMPVVDADWGGSSIFLSGNYDSYFNSINHYDFQINSSFNYNIIGSTAFNNGFSFTNLAANNNIEPTNSAQISRRTFGALVGTSVRILNNTGAVHNWTFKTSVQYFNERGNVLQSISQNIKAGNDITTNLYHFSGLLLNSHNRHTATINGSPNTIEVITYPEYDKNGRITALSKKYNNNNYKSLAQYSYNTVGQLQTKTLAPKYYNVTRTKHGIEELNYTYTINGALDGINKDYAINWGITEQWSNYFGMHLGYSNNSMFSTPQYNGAIAGTIWKTQGDNTPRKFDYIYDNLGRFTAAVYDQKDDPSQSWGTNQFNVNYYNSTNYADKNGNIGSSLKMGMLPGNNGAIQIDNLDYRYALNSNKLVEVRDLASGQMGLSNGHLADFADGINAIGTNDYTYDSNGNVTTDLNKKILANNIVYNNWNKPEKITLNPASGPIVIEYTYNALGEKLSKKTTISGTTTTTTYIGNYIYTETAGAETLAYILNEEGRIKVILPVSNANVELNQGAEGIVFENGHVGVFEYFIKDHLSNTRMVLTEEEQTEFYRASMDAANASTENDLFGQVDITSSTPYAANELELTREPNPSPWGSNASNGEVSMLTTTQHGKMLGPNLMLKVMAGDKITSNVRYYYFQNNNGGGSSNNLNEVVNALIGSLSTRSTGIVNINKNEIQNSLLSSNPFYDFLDNNQHVGNTNAPKAYLNIVFFDEQFNFIPPTGYTDYNGVMVGSNVIRVEAEDNQDASLYLEAAAPKNGYVFIYLSNSSDEIVYFDDFYNRIDHSRISEETHYYAFGQKIAGLSSNAFNKLQNNYKFQANYSEEETETGYNEFDLRMYDPQLGRWTGADPYNEFASPYVGMGNNPTNAVDPDGGAINLISLAISGTVNMLNNSKDGKILDMLGNFIAGAAGSLVQQVGYDALGGKEHFLRDVGSYLWGGLITGIFSDLADRLNPDKAGKKPFIQYWAAGIGAVMTGGRLGGSLKEGAPKIPLHQEAIFWGTENMLTNYGKEETTNFGQFLGYFSAGAIGATINWATKKSVKNLDNKFIKSSFLSFGSMVGDAATNALNFYTKKDFNGKKFAKEIEWHNITQPKMALKALFKSNSIQYPTNILNWE